ncbi:MAB_1171c family putative transporter [Streptomyces mangrovisoli]|uniref:Uncharacterized protein n=1 Tax=Streptomyces mangrovisoli TaxID=1428628 RepID=A0A1J4NKD3_9ACTN|nr:MAB_1171c family putative transporter [Streptomyces mangrovisoli]OIJ62763.1 hypothetical protein WN71_037785 [Streptomyces mangrovisoli]
MPHDITGSFLAYAIPAGLLGTAFVIKLPVLRRAWRDPILRATALLLAIGAVVFASLPPSNLHRINEITGVPNFAGVWVYSLLSAYCGACLWLIIVWREPPSPARARRTRMVWIVYGFIILGLWVTFALGHPRVERLRDLDTYYANTPWMREHTMLYLVAHMMSAVVAAAILWAWFKELTHNKWLRRAVVSLQTAYALGFVFDVCKIIAVVARWTGHDLDWLSTYVAPPWAIAEAVLVAVGFIAGQAGPVVETYWSERRSHRRLEPLWSLMATVCKPPATGRISGASLKLEQRKAHINDGLLRISPQLNGARRDTAYRDALAAGHSEWDARGIAGAVDILVAVDLLNNRAVNHQALSHRAVNHQDMNPKPLEHQAVNHPSLDHQPLNHQAVNHQAVNHQAVNHQSADDAAKDARHREEGLLPDSDLEAVAHALRAHSHTIDPFRRQAAASEGLASHV